MKPLTPQDVTQDGDTVIVHYQGATCTCYVEPEWWATEIAAGLRDYLSVADVQPTRDDVDRMVRVVCGVDDNDVIDERS